MSELEQHVEDGARQGHPYRGQSPHVGSEAEAEGEDWEYENREDTPASTASGTTGSAQRQRSMSVMSIDEPYIPPIAPAYIPQPTPGSSAAFETTPALGYMPQPTPGTSLPLEPATQHSLPSVPGAPFPPFSTFEGTQTTPAYVPVPTPGTSEPYEDPPTPAFVPPPTPHSAPNWLDPDPAIIPPQAPRRGTRLPPTTNPNAENRRANLYPAYDASGRRIGLDPYVRAREASSLPAASGSHYRPRTLAYPSRPPDIPHVMSFDLQMNPTAPETHRRRRREDSAPPESPEGQSMPAPGATPPRGTNTSDGQDESSSEGEDTSPMPEGGSRARRKRGRPRDEAPPDFEEEEHDIPDPEHDLRTLLGFGPDEEVSLNSLVDPPDGEKPGYPYPTLIKLAIYGSPNKRLTLQDIYAALIARFKWFREHQNDMAWQVSGCLTLSCLS